MYASEVRTKNSAAQKLTFFVSGKLWGSSLVMEDKETGTEWSHILGRGMAGKLKGTKLTIIPSVMSNWGRWKQDHPNTTVTTLSHVLSEFTTDFLKRDSDRFGLGLVQDGQSRFWRFKQLLLEQIVNDNLAKQPVVVYFDVPSRTPVAWSRRLSKSRVNEFLENPIRRPIAGSSSSRAESPANVEVSNEVDKNADQRTLLTFRMTAQGVQDAETQSIWDLRNGVAMSGTLKGTRLRALPAIVSFTSSWQRFHPDSTEWKP